MGGSKDGGNSCFKDCLQQSIISDDIVIALKNKFAIIKKNKNLRNV